MLVGDIIRRTAAKHPNKVGVVFENKRYTWEEVNRRVNCLANGLIQLGLQSKIELRSCLTTVTSIWNSTSPLPRQGS